MRILILHQYYLRPDEAGGARFNVMARRWAEAGHQVCVVADQARQAHAHEATPEAPWRVIEHPGGPGQPRVERVRASGPMARAIGPLARRTIRASRFAQRAEGFWAYALGASLAAWQAQADVVIASSPSLLVLVPGLVARATGARLVFEVRDLWPESAVTTGVLEARAALTLALQALERLGYAASDAVNALTPGIAQDIQRRAAPARLWIFPNGVELERYEPSEALTRQAQALRLRLGWGERFTALYAGAHGLANGLDVLIHAAHRLRRRPEVQLAALGDGPERQALRERTLALGLGPSQLQWLEAAPYAQVPAYMSAADAGLVLLRAASTFKTVYPNKLFEIMAAGRPVICNVPGQASGLVAQAQAGLCLPPEDPAALADAALKLAREPAAARQAMGRRGQALVRRRFDRAQIARDYLSALEALAQES